MSQNHITPSKQGQIVKSLITLPGIDEADSFLLADDPTNFKTDDLVTVYSISEFLRCHSEGRKPEPIIIQLKSLTVVGDNLQSWVESWNEQKFD